MSPRPRSPVSSTKTANRPPGMNYFGMTREEARRFMRENTLESETQIATESLRYSTDLPGQALAWIDAGGATSGGDGP